MHPKYGNWGGKVELFEAYLDFRSAYAEKLGIEEADSKADFPSWLWGPVRRSVWQGYTKIEPQWEKYARIESMPDFRPRLIHGLNSLKGYGWVGDHGEYPGMRRTERGGPALVIDTYGGVYSITRQAIINDDSGDLLNRNPSDMGYAAGQFVAEAIIALIESNPTAYDGTAFFHTSRGNLVTSALSEDSLADAMTHMESMLDDDGYRIRIRAASLLVKTFRMEMIARRIINSTVTGTQAAYTGAAGAGSAIFDKGTINPLAGVLAGDAIIRDNYLSDANDWYLFADPADVPAFAVGYLNGQAKPFVGLKDPAVRNALGAGMDPYTFELDSIDFKVRQAGAVLRGGPGAVKETTRRRRRRCRGETTRWRPGARRSPTTATTSMPRT